MKKIAIVAGLVIAACQPAPDQPKTFEDLLKITDSTDEQICTLAVSDFLRTMTPEELETAKAKAFDFENLIADTVDNPAAQIKILFRRSALRRRLLALEGNAELANEFYQNLNASETKPESLAEYHEAYHYWMERIQEQSQYGDPESVAFNLRFCVMNEKRAVLHAASRTDILLRIKNGVTLPSPELVENINHETSFPDGFSEERLAEIYTEETIERLTPLARAQMRGDKAFLPTDPKSEKLFWEKRDEEIAVMIEFIRSHDFKTPANQLGYMTDIDQSLRKLWNDNEAKVHFQDDAQFDAFRANIPERVQKIDEFNTAKLQNMLKNRGWFRDDLDGRGAANDAWLIAQHADRNPEFQKDVLKLIEAQLESPGVSKSNYAYLYDRVQMNTAHTDGTEPLLRYATQGRCTGPGTWENYPVEEPERIDALRAEVGLGTLADYKSRFKDMCTRDERSP